MQGNTQRTIAELFDEPVDSERHRSLRDTVWMGGALVELPYLLGRLTQQNLMESDTDTLLSTLRGFLTPLYPHFADSLCRSDALGIAVSVLRFHAKAFDDITWFGDTLENEAIHHLLLAPTSTDRDLSQRLNCTEGKVRRMGMLTMARRVMTSGR